MLRHKQFCAGCTEKGIIDYHISLLKQETLCTLCHPPFSAKSMHTAWVAQTISDVPSSRQRNVQPLDKCCQITSNTTKTISVKTEENLRKQCKIFSPAKCGGRREVIINGIFRGEAVSGPQSCLGPMLARLLKTLHVKW